MDKEAKKPSLSRYAVVLTIAGSDCSGGAGIQADIKAISALGGYAASVITSVTAQNTTGVKSVYAIPPDMIKAQAEAVMSDIHPHVVKIGMLGSPDAVDVVAEVIEQYRPRWVVLDPVMVSTSGHCLSDTSTVEKMVHRLFPLVSLITPNIPEACLLSRMYLQDGMPSDKSFTEKMSSDMSMTKTDMVAMAINLTHLGCANVLLKGGHLDRGILTDVFIENHNNQSDDGNIYECFDSKRIDTINTHGTGCTLSSAIAALLAQGNSLRSSVVEARRYLHAAMLSGANVKVGEGCGPVDFFHHPRKSQREK